MREINAKRAKPSAYVFVEPDGAPLNDMKLITLTRALGARGDWLDPDSGRPFTVHGFRASFEHGLLRPGRTARFPNWRWATSSTAPSSGDICATSSSTNGESSWTGGLAIARARAARSFAPARVMTRKLPPWLLDQRPFEGIAWLAKRRRAADQKKLSDPTEADIAEMHLAIGDDETFEKLAGDDKASSLRNAHNPRAAQNLWRTRNVRG